MYGMIHRAVRDMAIDRIGAAGWAEVEAQMGIGPAEFISLSTYSDELTVALIACTAEKLGLDMGAMLREFGQAWVRFAQRGSFGSMMDFTGRTLGDFIANLDRMHQAVVVAMPEARVPSFALVEDTGSHLLVDYRSERSGLEAFVGGLLEGLLDRFGLAGSVREMGPVDGGTRFEVTLAAAA